MFKIPKATNKTRELAAEIQVVKPSKEQVDKLVNKRLSTRT